MWRKGVKGVKRGLKGGSSPRESSKPKMPSFLLFIEASAGCANMSIDVERTRANTLF
jgi:hypothetical protein